MRWSIELGDGNGIFSFAKNMGKNIGKNLSGKFNRKLSNHSKQFATDALKTASKEQLKKKAEATCGLIGNKSADKIIEVSRSSP